MWITLLGGLFLAVGALSIGGGVWAYRRVVADYADGTATVAALVVGGLIFAGGWVIFAPAWLGGWLRRRLRPGGFRRRSGRFILGLLSVVVIGIMVIGVGEILGDRADARRTEALRAHGVTTTGKS